MSRRGKKNRQPRREAMQKVTPALPSVSAPVATPTPQRGLRSFFLVWPENVWELAAPLSALIAIAAAWITYEQYALSKTDFDRKTGKIKSQVTFVKLVPSPSQIDDRLKINLKDGNTMVRCADITTLAKIRPRLVLYHPGQEAADMIRVEAECRGFGTMDEIPRESFDLITTKLLFTDIVTRKTYDVKLPRSMHNGDRCEIDVAGYLLELIKIKSLNIDRRQDRFITVRFKVYSRLVGSDSFSDSMYESSGTLNVVFAPVEFTDDKCDSFLKADLHPVRMFSPNEDKGTVIVEH